MSFVAFDRARVAVDANYGRQAFNKKLLLSVAAITLIASSAAQANPAGGAVTTGSASISTSSNKTNVTQKSEGVVIDWSSFNIGSGQTTQFIQPNAQAIAVNRIGGAKASQILGTLDANGRVVLINGNGVLFGKGAQVNVGSLIATSTDGSDSDVLSGKFTQAGKQNASVVNNGTITAASGGVVALVAPNVTNTGTVNAKLGTVALGAANKFTVDFAGDGLVSFAAQGDVNTRASAVNSGALSGAHVSMTAHAADGIATGVVNMSGIVTAQGAQNVGGTIYLNAGNGTLTTTGTLNAAGVTGGGQIETSGHAANISGHITAGKGGLWKVDPEDLTIDSGAAGSIDGALNGGTSVLEQTTSGAASGFGNQTAGSGDITVASALSWNTTATLTLDSHHSINIDAPISITGGGGLTLFTNDNGGSGGSLSFDLGPAGFAGNIAYTDVVDDATAGSLSINGGKYTLVNNVTQLAGGILTNAGGLYALANSYDASGDGTYAQSPIGPTFTGTFEGLGNTISNLTINSSGTNVGLFAQVGSTGKVQDIGLLDVNVTGGQDDLIGGLVGTTNGSVDQSFVTGTISGASGSGVGGLAGGNGGTISLSYASATVSGYNATAGGLVGLNDPAGVITQSYAAGAVSSDINFSNLGGLAGENDGEIEQSFATASVIDTDNISYSEVGGLVGANSNTGQILDSYASGYVQGYYAGGLVGFNTHTIAQSYAFGIVDGGDTSRTGGLVGYDLSSSGDITSSYWDLGTTGITSTSRGAGNLANDSGITGKSTAALQATLPTGFDNTLWSIVPGVSFPYLTWQAPTGTPEVLAGTVYDANGTTGEADLAVTALIDGAQPSPLVETVSGANGYYYFLLAPGTISNSGNPVLAYISGGGVAGAAYVGNALGGDGNLKIEEDWMRVKTGLSSATGLNQALLFASGGDPTLLGFTPHSSFFLDDSATNFNFNSPFSTGTGTLWLDVPNGSITESGNGFIDAGLLRGTSKGGATLNGANDITRLGQFTNVGSGGFSLTNSDTLEIVGAVDAGTGDLSLITTANGLAIDRDLTAGGTVTLEAGSGIWQNPTSSIITADTLTGSSNGTTRLQGANLITDIGDFDVNDGNFVLTNDKTLTVTGTVGANGISLDTTNGDLVDSGALHANSMTLVSSLGEVYGTGNINTMFLKVTADTGIDLDGTSNNIHRVGTRTTASGPNVINTVDTGD